MRLSPGQVGTYKELQIASLLARVGFDIFRNLSPHGTDLLATKKGLSKIFRIEVKSSSKGPAAALRKGSNDILALCGSNGDIRFIAESKRAARYFPHCEVLRRRRKR